MPKFSQSDALKKTSLDVLPNFWVIGTSHTLLIKSILYEPNNCVWSTREEQGSNKRNNRWIEVDGERRTMGQWAKLLGASPPNIHRMAKIKGDINTIIYYKSKNKNI